MILNKKAQSIMEYLILVGIVTAVIVSMSTSLKRSIQSYVKVTADQIGSQQDAEQQVELGKGYLEEAASSTDTSMSKTTSDVVGTISYAYNDRTQITSNSLTNLGFTDNSD